MGKKTVVRANPPMDRTGSNGATKETQEMEQYHQDPETVMPETPTETATATTTPVEGPTPTPSRETPFRAKTPSVGEGRSAAGSTVPPSRTAVRDEALEKLYAFLTGPHWGRSQCTGVCNRIAGAGFPAPGGWDWPAVGGYKNVADLVYPLTTDRAYVELTWPKLRFTLGNKIGNLPWAAMTLTTLALFDVLHRLTPKK